MDKEKTMSLLSDREVFVGTLEGILENTFVGVLLTCAQENQTTVHSGHYVPLWRIQVFI